jgi:hypothetical protein
VRVLRGRGIGVTDDDHGTGSTIMSAIVVVNDMWGDRDSVRLAVKEETLPEGVSAEFHKNAGCK